MRTLEAMAFLAALAASSASVAAQDNVFEDQELKLRFQVPTDSAYEVRAKDFWWKWEGTVCEFVCEDQWVAGRLLRYDSGMSVAKFADWRESDWGKNNKSCRRVSEKKLLDKKHGSWLQVEFVIDGVVEGQERSYHYVEVMIADGKVNIEFMIWTFQDDWEDYMATMLEIADSMEFGELPELKPRFTNRVPRVKVDPEQRALMRRRDKKLAEDWVKKASWFTDYDKAREEAKKADKLIFAYFTRSYED